MYGRNIKVQRLVTGSRCEVSGCHEQAAWFITTPNDSYYWCVKDTVTRIEEKEF
jgi:hypothetical protein